MRTKKLKIGIVGVGMVGSPLKRYFEEIKKYERGEDLFLYDIDPRKGYADDVNQADAIFVCVPTPRSPDGRADLSAIDAAFRMLKNEKAVIIKSTVPPGTTESFQKRYPQHKVLFNPEFLTERRAWEDMVSPDRQIMGYTDASHSSASILLGLLPPAFFSSPGTLGTYTFVRVNATEAEMGKYAGNLFGAFKVSFGNVMKDFCDALASVLEKRGLPHAVDYGEVRAMLAHDRRIGDAWLDVAHGGYRGYGGYCFIKDTDALITNGEEILKDLAEDSPARRRMQKGLAFLCAMRDYNTTLLETQGLTPDDVAVHDHEWIANKLNKESGIRNQETDNSHFPNS